jgi:nucleoside-diphosphate-sugar epimerase
VELAAQRRQLVTRRAVVIGAAGFVGRRLVELAAGDTRHAGWPTFDAIHAVDVAPFGALPRGGTTSVTSGICDVRSRASLREALAGAHTVFHLASIVDVGLKKNAAIEAVNVEGTRNVVEVCRELGVSILVYTSSEDVALGTTPVRGGDESLPYPDVMIHDYVRTKVEGEKIARAADAPGALRTVAVRPVHVYGPRDPHALVVSLRAFASGTVPFLLGDGSARFDVVYVDNVVHGHLLAAAALADPARRDRIGGSAYVLNEDHAPNYFEWLRPYAESRSVKMPRRYLGRRRTALVAKGMELFHRLTGRDVPFHSFHRHVIGEDFYFSGAKARRELDYAPIVTPAEGQRRTIAWLADQRL